MPVKIRRSKRRIDPQAEAEAWATPFATGCDFFGDLEPFGIAGGPDGSPAVRAAMPEAWARLGRIFLDRGLGDGFNGPCRALEQFGEPEQCR